MSRLTSEYFLCVGLRLNITSLLPDKDFAEFGEPLPPDIIGATITAFDAPVGLDGVGLVLEYTPKGCFHSKVLALAFDESRI